MSRQPRGGGVDYPDPDVDEETACSMNLSDFLVLQYLGLKSMEGVEEM